MDIKKKINKYSVCCISIKQLNCKLTTSDPPNIYFLMPYNVKIPVWHIRIPQVSIYVLFWISDIVIALDLSICTALELFQSIHGVPTSFC